MPAITTGRRLDFSKDITRFSHFFTLNNVENAEMSFFFSNFALENLKRAPAKADTHYFLRARMLRTLYTIFQDYK